MTTKLSAQNRKAPSSEPGTCANGFWNARRAFYRQGVCAVGVGLVVEQAGVAKTSLYRHFRTKDDLVVAFLD
ncbi:helix-turn-helix domain-containing protein [Rhodanobacter sp. C01]|uniref:helix-turn-helix domain-containing protein n=1 Tax=Rhodanobacter sp. C01 TaxID=1945856 RepID=UPI001C2C1BF0|nr:helix-turn-helix domain-containing protein [Rhodanobacter sp. C01]